MAVNRCPWPGDIDIYIDYHDHEWGKPTYDDASLFEFLLLESFQAGLSWITILRKRGNLKKAFNDFDYRKIAKYTSEDQNRLLADSGIIRNKLKIKAAINNAQKFIEIQKEFGSFSTFFWSYTQGKPLINRFKTMDEVPARSALSDQISKDLKKRGFTFVGSTIVYAYMQACGMVNDHLVSCFCHSKT